MDIVNGPCFRFTPFGLRWSFLNLYLPSERNLFPNLTPSAEVWIFAFFLHTIAASAACPSVSHASDSRIPLWPVTDPVQSYSCIIPWKPENLTSSPCPEIAPDMGWVYGGFPTLWDGIFTARWRCEALRLIINKLLVLGSVQYWKW